ncbi:MAG: tRNA (adenosine(37)-N6)-threonylcarbamoyltransferase complex transferase subunit TsaD, partial [Ferruginibacter sp.]|nr:tRNA (adenosine(37)-N6)-threonylcarbamoyltransferase complex transferase subunit TsaD [Chitinophagaceae bacterium]
FQFPEPKIEGLNFSFSGVKTSILYFLKNAGKSNLFKEEFAATEEEKLTFIQNNLADICASVQHRIVTILLNKLKKASLETGITEICLAGGVSANSGLRKEFEEMGRQNGWSTFIPALEYCTDNAGMIAITGYYKYLAGQFADLSIGSSARAGW